MFPIIQLCTSLPLNRRVTAKESSITATERITRATSRALNSIIVKAALSCTNNSIKPSVPLVIERNKKIFIERNGRKDRRRGGAFTYLIPILIRLIKIGETPARTTSYIRNKKRSGLVTLRTPTKGRKIVYYVFFFKNLDLPNPQQGLIACMSDFSPQS